MAAPVTALTYDRLVLKVAEKLAIADYRTDGTPCLPYSDQFRLDKSVEMVDRGVGMLIDSAPPEGWRWMRRLASVTFDADGTGDDNIDTDAARYMLPLDFGGEVLGRIGYTASTGGSTGIQWCDEAVIRAARATSVSTGKPSLAAVRPYQPTSTVIANSRRWELIVDPQPSAADTIEFPYLLHFDGVQLIAGTADSADATTIVDLTLATLYPLDDMLNGMVVEVVDGTGQGSYATITDYTGATGTITVADWLAPNGAAAGTNPDEDSGFIVKECMKYYHPAGFAFDNIIEVACLAACEMFGADQVNDDHYTAMFYQRKIKEGYLINNRQGPRRLGRWTNGTSQGRERTWDNVTTDHDV